MTPAAVARTLRKELRARADPRVAASSLRFFKERVSVLGVTTPELRRVVRGAWKEACGDWAAADALALCAILLPARELEIKHAALLLCGRFAGGLRPGHLTEIRSWVDRGWCASWATIDLLCYDVVGPLVERHPKLLSRTARWTASRNLWLRRSSVVALVKAAGRGRCLDAAYDVVARLLDDTEDLIHKACGWLLREAGRTDRRRLEAFLREHGPRVPRTTVRYAIEHFPEARRRRVLRETRG